MSNIVFPLLLFFTGILYGQTGRIEIDLSQPELKEPIPFHAYFTIYATEVPGAPEELWIEIRDVTKFYKAIRKLRKAGERELSREMILEQMKKNKGLIYRDAASIDAHNGYAFPKLLRLSPNRDYMIFFERRVHISEEAQRILSANLLRDNVIEEVLTPLIESTITITDENFYEKLNEMERLTEELPARFLDKVRSAINRFNAEYSVEDKPLFDIISDFDFDDLMLASQNYFVKVNKLINDTTYNRECRQEGNELVSNLKNQDTWALDNLLLHMQDINQCLDSNELKNLGLVDRQKDLLAAYSVMRTNITELTRSIAEHVSIPVLASTYYAEAEENARFYLHGKAGYGYAFDLVEPHAYAATSIYLKPLYSEWKVDYINIWDYLLSRFSINTGVTIASDITQPDDRDGIVGSEALLLGLGYRFIRPIQLNADFLFYRKTETIMDMQMETEKKELRSAFSISASFLFDISSTFKKNK